MPNWLNISSSPKREGKATIKFQDSPNAKAQDYQRAGNIIFTFTLP